MCVAHVDAWVNLGLNTHNNILIYAVHHIAQIGAVSQDGV